ncbi:MAG: Rrf2 family transcriptional regulator [Anaerolineae bacterium]
MKLSTKARYGLRAMVDLALHCDQHPVPRKDIARRQDISPHYMEQLFAKMRDAGLIEAIRGPGGGYLLSKSPEEITVGAVIRAVDEVLAPVPCLRTESPLECDRAPTCVTRRLWKDLGDRTDEFLESRTIQDLCDEAREIADSA